MVKAYAIITKPGILFGNLITISAGFILASKGSINPLLFLEAMLGITCVIASACVFNNYIDRGADKKMERTKNRPLPLEEISGKDALTFASLILVSGVLILSLYTNILTVFISLTGFFVYVVLYTLLKYKSPLATAVGSISGAVPPIAGYCAVTGKLDTATLILFGIMVLWQMPHFFAIALYRFKDYAKASIPVLPIKRGIPRTKIHMLLYVIAFLVTAPMLTFAGYTGYAYLATVLALGSIWLILCIQGFKDVESHVWGRKMFILSLVVITLQSALMAIDVIKG